MDMPSLFFSSENTANSLKTHGRKEKEEDQLE
jgi:hypothetical protein